MTAYNRLDLLFQQNNGIVKTAQVLEIGIAKSTFYAYAKQRGVEQAAHGVYVSPDADGIKVYTIKKELHDVGIVTMNTPFGNPVPVYDMERTICDLIRSRSGIEMQTFQDALKQYAKRKDKDLRKLMRYAQMFRVEKLLRQYLEVLL